MPDTKVFGAVGYTRGEAFPLAVFDSTGRLVWSRPGYTPSPFGPAAADTVKLA